MAVIAVTLAAVGVVAAAAAWCAADVGRTVACPSRRRAWWSALALAVIMGPILGGPSVPVRVDRTLYEGPDLLSPAPEITVTAAERRVFPGLVRTRSLRTTQGDVLLREAQRVEVTLPILFLAVLGAWALVRILGRPPSAGRPPGAALLVVVAGLAVGCGAGDGPRTSVAEARLMELMAMRHSGDVTGAEEILHPVAVFDDYPNQLQYRGLPEIAEAMQSLHRWASGVFLDVVRVHAAGDRAAAEWIMEGVQSAPYPGVADSATFRRFRLEGVTVVEVERGLIVRVADYADMVPLILDLGGAVTLPSGEIVARPETVGDSLTGPPPRR